MLQFLASTSTLNIGWLTLLIIGTKAYNTPPLFFIGGFMLAGTALYGMTLRKEALQFVFLVGGLGVLSAGLHGMTFWHVRQIIAFTASAVVWIYLYQQASYRDIFTLRNSQWMVVIYGAFMVLVLAEKYLLGSARLTYIVSSIFAIDPVWLSGYVQAAAPRLSYFSVEPSSAACAIAGVIMPYIAARAAARPSVEAYVWLGISCMILYFAEGLTSQLFILYTFGFLLLPRQATFFIPIVFAGILALALSFMQVLNDHNYLNFMLKQWFGGIYSRLDQGLSNGSYLSRIGTWFIAAREFANSPIYGQGIGGSGADMFNLAQSGLDVFFTDVQSGTRWSMAAPMFSMRKWFGAFPANWGSPVWRFSCGTRKR